MKVKLTSDGISEYLNGMLKRAKLVDGWLNRVAYPEILKVQKVRWQTEGTSEGHKWEPIRSKNYKTYKLKRFADYPGAGKKLMIATGRLAFSLSLDSSFAASPEANKNDHFKIVRNQKLEVGSFVPYGAFQEAQGRDLSTLSEATQERLAKALGKYLINGKMSMT